VHRTPARFAGLYFVFAALVIVAIGAGLVGGGAQADGPSARPLTVGEQYPYGGRAFDVFVRDSYALTPDGKDTPDFYAWFDRFARTYWDAPHINGWLDKKKQEIAASDTTAERAKREREVVYQAFRLVKHSLPRFSLDRGFEFTNAVKSGERQCLLQSVLVAGLCQRAGVPVGVVMVWKGDTGEISNLGHCVALARFADGSDRIYDVSTHNRPDVPHQGLFLADATGAYRFVLPVYGKDRAINGYRAAAGGDFINPGDARTMDSGFLRSQFDYYRGERAPGRLIWKAKSPESVAKAATALTRAVNECPKNPLATYMLGKMLSWQGKDDAARQRFADAHRLYRAAGWVPDSAEEIIALEHGTGVATASPAR
jgi:hypothetical protein